MPPAFFYAIMQIYIGGEPLGRGLYETLYNEFTAESAGRRGQPGI